MGTGHSSEKKEKCHSCGKEREFIYQRCGKTGRSCASTRQVNARFNERLRKLIDAQEERVRAGGVFTPGIPDEEAQVNEYRPGGTEGHKFVF